MEAIPAVTQLQDSALVLADATPNAEGAESSVTYELDTSDEVRALHDIAPPLVALTTNSPRYSPPSPLLAGGLP